MAKLFLNLISILLFLICCNFSLAEDPPATEPTAAPAGEVEPLDSWTPVVPGKDSEEKKIKTSNEDAEAEKRKFVLPSSDDEDAEDVIEIKAIVSDPGLKKIDPEEMLKKELKPESTKLTKKEQKRFEQVFKNRSQVAREQSARLGIKKKSDLDPRGEPEITICSLNANNYGTDELWKATFRRTDVPKRAAMRRSMSQAINNSNCDLIALQTILGKEDADAIQAAKELVGFKEEDQNLWKVLLGRATREVSRNAILYRAKFRLAASDDFRSARLTTFGSFKLDQFGLPPIRGVFEVPRKGADYLRRVSLISFTLKNSATFTSDESELKRVQLAEYMRGQTTGIKREEGGEGDVVVLAGNRAGPSMSVGTQIMEGRFKLADFVKDGACIFTADGGYYCDPERIRPKELFGVVGSSAAERISRELSTIKLRKSYREKFKNVAGKRSATVTDLLTSEIYLDGSDYYLGLANPIATNWFDLHIIPVRNGLPEAPFLALKLNW